MPSPKRYYLHLLTGTDKLGGSLATKQGVICKRVACVPLKNFKHHTRLHYKREWDGWKLLACSQKADY